MLSAPLHLPFSIQGMYHAQAVPIPGYDPEKNLSNFQSIVYLLSLVQHFKVQKVTINTSTQHFYAAAFLTDWLTKKYTSSLC